MRKSRVITGIAVGLALVVVGGGLAVGDYIYTSGTKVNCAVNADDLNHTPAQFYTGGVDNGPFPGEGWNKWVDYDLSSWWLKDAAYEELMIPVADGVELAAWWIAPHFESTKKTIIVTHGIGTSKQDFNTLLPASMLVKGGYNVLLVDQRDAGESTCTDGRHSAGQEESSDFAAVAKWLNVEKQVPATAIGMFGVSGGAIATSLVPAKSDLVSAFAMEGTIFDFNAAATQEVEFQGFPGVLWQFAQAAAFVLHGVNLAETSVTTAIDAAGSRPMLILHGDADQRLKYQSSVDFYNYAKSAGVDIELETFVGADHTEGMLSETERYAQSLVGFFDSALR